MSEFQLEEKLANLHMKHNAKKSSLTVDYTAEKRPAPATTTKHVRFDISTTNSTASSYPPYPIHKQMPQQQELDVTNNGGFGFFNQQQKEPADVSISSGFNFFTTPRGYGTPAKKQQQTPKKANVGTSSMSVNDPFSTSFSDMDYQEQDISKGRDYLDTLFAKPDGAAGPTKEKHQTNQNKTIADASSKNADDPMSISILDLDMNMEQDVTFSKGDYLAKLFGTTGGDAGPSKEQSFQFNFDTNDNAGGSDQNAPFFSIPFKF